MKRLGGGGEGEEHTETNIKSQYTRATQTNVLYTGRKLTLNGFALPNDCFLTSLSFGFMFSMGPVMIWKNTT